MDGLGLSLRICKHMVEQLGGSVQVESKIGKGTIFTVSLMSECVINKNFLPIEEN